MIRNTTLFAGVAAVLSLAAPALAQDAAPATAVEADASAEVAAQPHTLTLQPGSIVTGSDGLALGKLEGARVNAEGEQELTVRGPDDQLRAVPLAGLRQEGSGVVVGWTQAEFTAAASLTRGEESSSSRPRATPATPAVPATPADPSAGTPATPATRAVPAMPARPVPNVIPSGDRQPVDPDKSTEENTTEDPVDPQA